jgi:hypothetical protein
MINLLEIDKNEITKCYYIIYFTLLKTKEEINYVKSIFELIDKYGIYEFKNILNIKILIFNLYDEKLMLSYKMSLIQYVKSDIYYKIKDYVKINNIKILNDKLYDDYIYDILLNIKKNIMYINSFDIFNNVSSNNLKDSFELYDSDNQNNKYNMNTWCEETKHEIINRLILITSYFKIKLLKELGIKKIKNNMIIEMTYSELAKYYNNSIEIIKKYYKRNYQMFGIYEEIVKKYSNIKHIDNLTDFNLTKFDIIITK